ncbi:hypothetical protein SBA4_3130005 [Candidatus Sulfopaludibacter sp. SbA4]|nr:hypothetical protein SBA4_3130005 [Candidatus Sulfopaludibacter sp. SbA4]
MVPKTAFWEIAPVQSPTTQPPAIAHEHRRRGAPAKHPGRDAARTLAEFCHSSIEPAALIYRILTYPKIRVTKERHLFFTTLSLILKPLTSKHPTPHNPVPHVRLLALNQERICARVGAGHFKATRDEARPVFRPRFPERAPTAN